MGGCRHHSRSAQEIVAELQLQGWRLWRKHPFVDGGVIKAEVVAHGRGEKVKIVKFRRRKHYRKQQGHRQWFTDVKITGISA